jgi:hypothetical protein
MLAAKYQLGAPKMGVEPISRRHILPGPFSFPQHPS